MTKSKYQVRFNLGRGNNYKKWKISKQDGVNNYYNYYDPNIVTIRMKGCKLHNRKGTANRIYNGANKTVCAWIECNSIEIEDIVILRSSAKAVCYNPRVTPNWTLDDLDMDQEYFEELFTVGNSIRIKEK